MRVNEALAALIRVRIKELKTTVSRASIEAGLGKYGLYDILRGRSSHPRVDTLLKVADALKLPVDALLRVVESAEVETLLRATGRIEGTQPARPGVPIAASDEAVETEIVRTSVGEEFDFPVYSAVEAGPGEVVFSAEPVEWVRRPEPLFRIKRGFGLVVVGTSMEPAFFDRDMALIHPTRHPRGGDHVVLTKADVKIGGVRAMLKRLVRWDDKTWTLRQYNPDRTWKAKREDWPHAFSVVGKYDRR